MPFYADISELAENLSEKYVGFLTDICNIESPTSYKEGVDAVGNYIIAKAKEMGWKTEIGTQQSAGNTVCITMNPDAKEKPVVFSAHMDTVHPVGSFGIPAVRREGDKLFGPGTVDCKGGIAISFFAMELLARSGFSKRPVKLFLQSDEEVGSKLSNKTTLDDMYEKSKDCIAFFNGEGQLKDSIVIARKGILRYNIEVTGIPCHSSVCNTGANAVLEAAHKIIELEKMKDKDGLTCNCGTISGGTTANTVAEKCRFTADIRYKTAEEKKTAQAVIEDVVSKSFVKGTSATCEIINDRPCMEKTQKNIWFYDRMCEIYRENGIPQVKAVCGNGGSDAAYMTERGLACLDNFGTYGQGLHTPGEFAYISSIAEAAKRLATIAYYI